MRVAPADLEELLPLRTAVLRPGQPLGVLRAAHGVPGAVHLGAWDDHGGLVGTGSVLPGPSGTWWVRGMAVEPAARGRGVGSEVLAALLSAAPPDAPVWLSARVAAVPLYARAGFVPVGGVYDEPGIGPHQKMQQAAGEPVAVDVPGAPGAVARWAADHLQEWASGVDPGAVRWVGDVDAGVLDHRVDLPGDRWLLVPLRVAGTAGGSRVSLWLRRADTTPDEAHAADRAAVAADLARLAALLSAAPGGR